ncbi:hypothetical protein PT974_00153 [Cladobotryum mycophilum]|uniref:Uncharacterized protein n=1 Tax=Cladobotryum mycophilum TaxID=491253 RepID=A0ABR0T0B3_9HYPO
MSERSMGDWDKTEQTQAKAMALVVLGISHVCTLVGRQYAAGPELWVAKWFIGQFQCSGRKKGQGQAIPEQQKLKRDLVRVRFDNDDDSRGFWICATSPFHNKSTSPQTYTSTMNTSQNLPSCDAFIL